jgi:hypothetical protein
MQQSWTDRDNARAKDSVAEKYANPAPRFQLGQMVKAIAFVDCFKRDNPEVSNLIVTEMRLIDSGLPPYWRIKAESLEKNNNSYVEGAERFFAHQIEVQS